MAAWFAARGKDVVGLLAGIPGAVPGVDTLDAWARDLAGCGRGALRFVVAGPQEASGLAYEARIAAEGAVPTRPASRHDACNALAWMLFPATKAALNALHCGPALAHPAGSRGGRRDAATLVDEFGVVVLATDPALAALWRAHAWHTLFHARRADVTRAMCIGVLGHGLAASLCRPFPGLTAKALVLEVDVLPGPVDRFAALDAAAATALRTTGASLSPAMLLPLPIQAWPAWAPDDPTGARFADTAVFRPRRGRH